MNLATLMNKLETIASVHGYEIDVEFYNDYGELESVELTTIDPMTGSLVLSESPYGP